MTEKLMRDSIKADESRLPGICSLDWEYSLSSVFVEVETPLVSVFNYAFYLLSHESHFIYVDILCYPGPLWHKKHCCVDHRRRRASKLL